MSIWITMIQNQKKYQEKVNLRSHKLQIFKWRFDFLNFKAENIFICKKLHMNYIIILKFKNPHK